MNSMIDFSRMQSDLISSTVKTLLNHKLNSLKNFNKKKVNIIDRFDDGHQDQYYRKKKQYTIYRQL